VKSKVSHSTAADEHSSPDIAPKHPQNSRPFRLSKQLTKMNFFASTSVLAGSTLLHSTLASPLAGGDTFAISARDIFVDSTTNCRDIMYGATSIASGKTCIGITEGTLTVTANVAEA
jgi:hypothetical protein